MKSKAVVLTFLILISVMFNACNKNTTEPNSSGVTGNFFPNNDGTTYKYSVQKTDSTGTTTSGTRTTTYSGTTTFGGVVYQNEVDSLNIMGVTSSFINLFKKSDTEVNFAIDTTGFAASIPAAYLPYISLDASLKMFQFPFQDGGNWPVFNVYLKLQGISINVLSITASYLGMEPVTLNLNTGTATKSAAKIQYQFKLISNPLNPLAASTYTANVWMVDNIGIVKWQGNGTILNAFTGGGINFADTTSTVSQSLISYTVK